MGDYVNAVRDYQAALRTEPSFGLAYYNAANVYFRQRQFQQVRIGSLSQGTAAHLSFCLSVCLSFYQPSKVPDN